MGRLRVLLVLAAAAAAAAGAGPLPPPAWSTPALASPAPPPAATPPGVGSPAPAAAAVRPVGPAAADLPLDLALPTDNDALYRGDGPAFYQVVPRNFHDTSTLAWEGGQYGFVRDPVDSPAGVLFVRFHEGIDIRPLRRDGRGEPLDEVRAAAPGRVAHVSPQPGASNYGRYVVVEHAFGGCPYFSLYAHLSEIWVAEGQRVERRQPLGRMGHTGEGIDKPRSHLHFEFDLMLSTHFDVWFPPTDPGIEDHNRHGLYHGQNLAGLDAARLLLALRANPQLTVPEFLRGEEPFFWVLVPAGGPGAARPDLLRLYPWLEEPAPPGPSSPPPAGAGPGPAAGPPAVAAGAVGSAGGAPRPPASWEVGFDRTGLPLRLRASPVPVAAPVLSRVQPAPVPYWQVTRRLVFGSGASARLSPYGRKLVETIFGPAEASRGPEPAATLVPVGAPPPRPPANRLRGSPDSRRTRRRSSRRRP